MDQQQIEDTCKKMLVADSKVEDWLCERINASPYSEYDQPIDIPRWWQICTLVSRNGGWKVHGWGFMSSAGVFGSGLDQNEALTLISYKAFIDGAEWSGLEIYEALYPVFQEFIRIHEELKSA